MEVIIKGLYYYAILAIFWLVIKNLIGRYE